MTGVEQLRGSRFSGPMCCCDVCRGLPWPASVYGLVLEPNPQWPGTAECA
jgi:hypothetical protein